MEIIRPEVSIEQTASQDDGLRFLTAVFRPNDRILIRPIETWTEQDEKSGKVKKRSKADWRGTTYDTLAKMSWRLNWHRERSAQTKCNVFFAVCPRHGADGQFDEAWQIRSVLVLWADIDDAKPDETLERCRKAGLPPPSIVVSSGRGTHLYWILSEPFSIDDGDSRPIYVEWLEPQNGDGKKTQRKYIVEPNEDRKYLDTPGDRPVLSAKAQQVQRVLAGIAERIGGDSTHDLSRLLRVPGTENRKDERNGRAPQPCSLYLLDTSRRYAFDVFAGFAIEPGTAVADDNVGTSAIPVSSTLPPEERKALDALLHDCEHASDRSKADFALCTEAVKREWGKEVIWSACSHVGKVAEEGRRYFDRTWSKAEDAVRQSTAAPTKKPPKRIRFVDVGSYKPFPVDALPEPVRGYIQAAAKALGCDPAYIALPLMIALSAAIGTTRWIRLKRTWREPLVMWGGIVGESGTLKSPAIDMATAPLQRKQAEAIERYADDMVIYQRDLQLYEADMLAWKGKGRKAGEPPPEKPKEPQPARCIIDDITIEAVVDRLQHNPRGLLVVRDELAGWVLALNQYKGGRGADAAVWLKMHGARAVINDRKTGTKLVYVSRAGVWIIGGIQPGILRRILTPEYFECGLSARQLLVMPPAPPKRWTEATVDEDTEAALDFIFDKLLALDFDTDEEGKTRPVDLDLTREGKQVWIAFYNEHALEQTELTGDLAAAWSKLEGYAARFALLVHLLRWAADDATLEHKNKVDAQSVEAGATLARWFGAEAKRIYAILGDDPDTADLRRTLDLIRRKHGTITVRELEKSDRRFRGRQEDAEAELNKLVAAGLGAWETVPPGPKGGASKRAFRLSALSAVGGTPQNTEELGGCADADNADKPNGGFNMDLVNEALAQAAEEEERWTL